LQPRDNKALRQIQMGNTLYRRGRIVREVLHRYADLLEECRAAAERGHKVMLLEYDPKDCQDGGLWKGVPIRQSLDLEPPA
jgi:hypothetical protein